MSTALATPASPPPRWAIVGSFAVIFLVWGSTFLGIRVAVETLPPLTMAAVRFLVSGAVLLLVSSGARPRPSWLEWRNATLVGALFFLGNHALVTTAASHIPSSLACLIVSTEVPIIAVLSAAFLPGHPLTRSSVLGAVLGLLGVAVLFGGTERTLDGQALASLAVLGASFSWSAGAVVSQRVKLPSNAVLRSGMLMFSGGVLLSVASVLRGEPWTVTAASFSPRSLLALAYLITFGSILAFGCYSYLLKHVRADAVATHVFVNPLVAVALGAWLGGEQLRPVHLLSGLFILASVVVVMRGQRSGAGKLARPTPPAARSRETGVEQPVAAAPAGEA